MFLQQAAPINYAIWFGIGLVLKKIFRIEHGSDQTLLRCFKSSVLQDFDDCQKVKECEFQNLLPGKKW
jgi:hypothetical protein